MMTAMTCIPQAQVKACTPNRKPVTGASHHGSLAHLLISQTQAHGARFISGDSLLVTKSTAVCLGSFGRPGRVSSLVREWGRYVMIFLH